MLSFIKSVCLGFESHAKLLLASCLCAIIGRGSEGGFLLFVYEKTNAPASLLLHVFLLGQKNKAITFKMSIKMGSNLGQPVFMFSYIKQG